MLVLWCYGGVTLIEPCNMLVCQAVNIQQLKGKLQCKMKSGMLKYHTELVCLLRIKTTVAYCISNFTIFTVLVETANNASAKGIKKAQT